MPVTEQKTISDHCNRCLGRTNHRIIETHVQGSDEKMPDGFPCLIERFEILECCGCGMGSFRHIDECNDETRYPPLLNRRNPDWRWRLPEVVRTLFQETYVAYSAGAHSLTAMGIRATVDAACNDKIGDCGNFQQKLVALAAGEFISSKEKEILEPVVDAGNAAAHRGFAPSPEQLTGMMDILEHMLQVMYVLSEVAENVRTATPRRP